MVDAKAIAAKNSKEKIATKLANVRNRLARASDVAKETGSRFGTTASTFGAFAASRIYSEYRRHKNQRNTFDKKGRFHWAFWLGAPAAVVGITPWSGAGGRYLAAGGTGMMCAGAIPNLDKFAKDLATSN